MVLGPIGMWTNPPSTFPFMHETVEFHSDGTGRVSKFSASDSEPSIDPFVWRMVEKGSMRIAPSEELLFDDGFPRIMAFEMVVQGTEFAEELVIVTAGKKIFDNFWLTTALVREDPPLRLPRLPYRPTRWTDFWTHLVGTDVAKIVLRLGAWLTAKRH